MKLFGSEILGNVTETVIRAIFLYFLTLTYFRLMGKRTLGEMQPHDFVVVIAMAEVLGEPLADPNLKMWSPLAGITTLAILQFILAWVALKNRLVRNLIEGKAALIVKNGQAIPQNMAKAKYNMDDLVEHLREKGIRSVDDVELAYLEPNGGLSVIKKKEAEPVTPRYLGTAVSVPLIFDGKLDRKKMHDAGIGLQRLKQLLERRGIKNISDVETAFLDPTGKLQVKKQRRRLNPVKPGKSQKDQGKNQNESQTQGKGGQSQTQGQSHQNQGFESTHVNQAKNPFMARLSSQQADSAKGSKGGKGHKGRKE